MAALLGCHGGKDLLLVRATKKRDSRKETSVGKGAPLVHFRTSISQRSVRLPR